MLRKRKEEKVRKSILEALMRDMQGTAAQKLVLFEKLNAEGGFVNASAKEVRKAEVSAAWQDTLQVLPSPSVRRDAALGYA
jgi:hypothetical protein